MRAVVQRELGPPDVLRIEEWPTPEPQAGQLLIDMEIANITFIETQLRAGRAPNPARLRALPTIPGNGVGGVVSAVGAEVDAALVGTRVSCEHRWRRGLRRAAGRRPQHPDWPAGLEPVDVVFDGVGGALGSAAFELLRPGGRLSGFGLASGTFAAPTRKPRPRARSPFCAAPASRQPSPPP